MSSADDEVCGDAGGDADGDAGGDADGDVDFDSDFSSCTTADDDDDDDCSSGGESIHANFIDRSNLEPNKFLFENSDMSG